MVKQAVLIALWATSMCVAAMSLSECADRSEETQDAVVKELRWLRPRSAADKERIDRAISLRQNGLVDCTPLLLFAYIGEKEDCGDGRAGFALTFGFYDEDKDVVGCAIREEQAAPDGSRETLLEKYPVFTYYPTDGTLQFRFFPIRARASDQRKDDHQWQEYIEAHTLAEISTHTLEYFAGTLPPVYVSIPEPNHTHVLVYLYDQAGHESNTVELYHAPPQKGVTPK